MTALAAYEQRREALAAQLRAIRSGGGHTVALRKSTSNLFRVRAKNAARKLDVRPFTHILEVDPERMIAQVEGMAPYAAVVEETLRYGLLPLVTPQLKTITVGGAVSGLGIESSSFRWGLVHDGVDEMDILLGDGRTLTCSRDQQADLFRGFPNSYGTLGYALRLKIRLMAARPFVSLEHTRFTGAGEYFAAISRLSDEGSIDFIDGTVFARDEMYVSTGRFVDSAPFTSDYTWLRIYYRSIRERETDYLSARDYIWRWDTDWFWCSKHFYAQNRAVRFLATRRL
ncbi:MAG TPA: FAD-binding oxidoreductase, partial [Bryobacteraceae bacterium]|nr:FAD-binding oxidoreductase [Bryobacteraceae bacterium]